MKSDGSNSGSFRLVEFAAHASSRSAAAMGVPSDQRMPSFTVYVTTNGSSLTTVALPKEVSFCSDGVSSYDTNDESVAAKMLAFDGVALPKPVLGLYDVIA